MSQRQNVPLHYAPSRRHNVPTDAPSPATFCPTFSIFNLNPHTSGKACTYLGQMWDISWAIFGHISGYYLAKFLATLRLHFGYILTIIYICNRLCLCIYVPLPFLNSYQHKISQMCSIFISFKWRQIAPLVFLLYFCSKQ